MDTLSSTYMVLRKKIVKVEGMLQSLSQDGKGDTKEFRAFQRKLNDYNEKLKRTKEYKQEKLNSALLEVRAINSHSTQLSCHSIDTNGLSSGSDDSSTDSDESSSSSSSSSSSDDGGDDESGSEERMEEYRLLIKKWHKVECLIAALEEKEDGKESPQHQKYVAKRTEYLNALKSHRPWKRDEEKERDKLLVKFSKEKAEREAEQAEQAQRRAVEEERKSKESELKKAKEEALAKLRSCQAARQEQEKLEKMIREKAEEDARQNMQNNMSQLEKEAEKRRKEYEKSLREQEERGLIRVTRRS